MGIKKEDVEKIYDIDNGVARSDVPVNQFWYEFLAKYIRKHESSKQFRNSTGEPVFFVNKRLVVLEKGAGFGELALMSSVKRMASVVTATDSCFATLTRQEFLMVMRRSQKRKMENQLAFLQKFTFFKDMTNIKL